MNRFLTYSFASLAALLLSGCGQSGNGFTIEGDLDGMKAGDLFIYSPANPNASIDTLKIADGHFEYSGEVYDTIPYVILFPNAVEQVVFVSPGKTIEYEAATNDLKNYRVEGTEENELMMQFRDDNSEKQDAEITDAAIQFIQEHPESVVSLYLFDKYLLQTDNPNYAVIRKSLEVLRTYHPTNLLLFSTENMLTNAGVLKEGKKLKNLDLLSPKREKKKLWSKSDDADYTFVVFWASWQRNSYDILYKIRNLQREYGERIRVVAISLDNQRYRWEDQVRRDSLVIEHYCDGLAWSSPVVGDLALESIPLYILVNPKHNIIIKTGDFEKIKDKLKKQLH